MQVAARLLITPSEAGSDAPEAAAPSANLAEDVYGPMSGQVTSVAKQAFRRALLEAGPRLVEAMFLCEVSTTADALSGGEMAGISLLPSHLPTPKPVHHGVSSSASEVDVVCKCLSWRPAFRALSRTACSQILRSARMALRAAKEHTLEGDPPNLRAGTYAVLGQRRARVLREELREGSDLFSIHAFLPAEASFGFVDDMRRRSSGAASASLMLSHWERLQVWHLPQDLQQRGKSLSSTKTNLLLNPGQVRPGTRVPSDMQDECTVHALAFGPAECSASKAP